MDLLGREALGVGGDEEAGEPLGARARLGLGEDHRDVREVAERDPHLLAVELPAASRSSPRGCAGWRRRSRCRARSGRSSRGTRPSTAWAASAAFAPRSPRSRSTCRRARSGPRRRCGRPSRRGRSARRSGRSRCSRGRGRRTPRRPARRDSPSRRASTRARGRTCRRGRSARARSTTSLSTKSRAVSEISFCSSVRSRFTGRPLPGRCRARSRWRS